MGSGDGSIGYLKEVDITITFIRNDSKNINIADFGIYDG